MCIRRFLGGGGCGFLVPKNTTTSRDSNIRFAVLNELTSHAFSRGKRLDQIRYFQSNLDLPRTHLRVGDFHCSRIKLLKSRLRSFSYFMRFTSSTTRSFRSFAHSANKMALHQAKSDKLICESAPNGAWGLAHAAGRAMSHHRGPVRSFKTSSRPRAPLGVPSPPLLELSLTQFPW